MSLDALQERLGHRFRDPGLLRIALTHASYAHENQVEHNERLEFLGDAVLQMATTLLLMERFPTAREGELSRLRARLVNTRALAAVARELGIADALRLGVGEESSGGRARTSILADAVEALLGAVHQDAGMGPCTEIVRRWMEPRLATLEQVDAPSGQRWKDPRSRLQELAQAQRRQAPQYRLLSAEGPPHDLVFTMAVELDGRLLGVGVGRSKRDASRAAAAEALTRLGPTEEVT